ncbi:hypothetical protein C8R44DRAFT_796101 [Mycena epipterygia]|nr:hypothetical protein C8R44DRAFT_796101 [Mycena epipterygia]
MATVKSNGIGTALEASGVFLAFMANAAQFTPVPYVQQLLSLAVSILNIIQRVQDNKTGFHQLAKDAGEIVWTVVESRVISVHMKNGLDRLILLLTDIENFALGYASRNALLRMLTSKSDMAKIGDYRTKMRQALDVFGLKIQISMHENIAQMLEERQEQMKLPPPFSTPPLTNVVDPSTPPSSTLSGDSTPPSRLVDPLQPSISHHSSPPPSQAVVANFTNSIGNVATNITNSIGFVNCSVGNSITVNGGDYNEYNSYQHVGDARWLGAYRPVVPLHSTSM